MSLSWMAHYKNKYPGGKVLLNDHSLDVFDADGNHVVALRKDGHGRMVCVSDAHGCADAHDLSPIPRDARIHKLHADGKVGLDEDHADRKAFMQSSAAKAFFGGNKVKSIVEIGKKYFDDKGNWNGPVADPVAAAPAAPVANS